MTQDERWMAQWQEYVVKNAYGTEKKCCLLQHFNEKEKLKKITYQNHSNCTEDDYHYGSPCT